MNYYKRQEYFEPSIENTSYTFSPKTSNYLHNIQSPYFKIMEKHNGSLNINNLNNIYNSLVNTNQSYQPTYKQNIFNPNIFYQSQVLSFDTEYHLNKKKEIKPTQHHNEKILEFPFFELSTTRNIRNDENIMIYVKEAYHLTTGYDLPKNISIKLCSNYELKDKYHEFNKEWKEEIQGFCINNVNDKSYIFVKKMDLGHTLLTIGHELGHLETAPLNPIDEEAKAYAFSMEWIYNIKAHNIGGLKNISISDNPVNNGIHDVAYSYVSNMIKKGYSALDIFYKLISKNNKSIKNIFK